MTLFIDASVRENSRTRLLAEYLLTKLNDSVQTLKLYEESLPVLNEAGLYRREKACGCSDFSGDDFRFARQFAAADRIVIAAPFWDASFPAILKQYIEAICVVGLTFHYSPEGFPVGLCRAKELYYVTTAGGKIYDRTFGYGYIEMLAAQMFGIPNCRCFAAENLDVIGADVPAVLEAGKRKIDEYFAEFLK